MKIFVTKYVLTQGILEYDNADKYISEGDVDRGTIWTGSPRFMESQLFHKGEWFETREEAVTDALKRVDAKWKSIKKQIEKLGALKDELEKERDS
jgi:hypothetical protein